MASGAAWSVDRLRNSEAVPVVSVVLRGLAQVDLMSSAFTGLFFTAALFVERWQLGLAGLLGVVLSTLTALALGVGRDRVRAGLEGFNGCLVGVGLVALLGSGHASTWYLVITCSVAVTVVTGALSTVLGTWNLSGLTMPFCIVVGVVTIAAPGFERVWHGAQGLSQLPEPAAGSTDLSWHDVWHGFFNNVSQIFLIENSLSGFLFLLGIFVAKWSYGVLACVGSAVGLAAASVLGSPEAVVSQGLMGYNAVLVALALGGVYLAPTGWSMTYAVVGAITATVLTAALTYVFDPVGGHLLTWPFVLTTLLFLAAVPSFTRLRRA